MGIKATRNRKNLTVPYRDARGVTRLVRRISAGSGSGSKLRFYHRPTKVVDNVAAATSTHGSGTHSRY